MNLSRLVSLVLLVSAASAFATVTVSSPKASSTVTSPVQYTATATASTCSKGVASMGIYVNNKLVYTVNGSKLSTSIALATGSQHTVVEEWDKCGKATYTTVNLTVVTALKPTVKITASPTSVKSGSSSTLTVTATNSTKVTLSGSDGSTFTFGTTGGTHSVTPTATATYTVTATGAGGTVTAKATVTVVVAPTVSISASPASIAPGASSTVTVTAANATAVKVTGSDGSSFTLASTGGTKSVKPKATTTYTASATKSGSTTATAKTIVTVTANPAPLVTIVANPTSIAPGGSSTLTVTAANDTAVKVTGSDGSSFTLASAGGTKSVKPKATTTYTASATKSGSTTATATATITVTANPAPTVSIVANPTSIASGGSSTLTVVAANATGVKITGSDSTSYTLAATGGTATVKPTTTTTYTVSATKSGSTTATASAMVTVTANPAPTVSIKANPTSIVTGNSSTLTVTAANATQVTIAGDDNTSYTLSASGGSQVVSPTSTTNYTATAISAGGATAAATATVTVGAKALTSISISPNKASFDIGANQAFTATGNYNDGSSTDVTNTATWTIANPAVASIDQTGQVTADASGSTTVTATQNGVSGKAPITATTPSDSTVNILTWHFDNNRSGLNANEISLSNNNVRSQTFGKLFSYLVDGYVYAQPLLVSNIKIGGVTRNVLFVATQYNSVYAFDADNYGSGAPLWKVSVMQGSETPDLQGPILPFEGVTSTPVIDLSSNTMYVVSKQHASGGNFFRITALDIITGASKLGGPVNINASVPATNSASVNGTQTLPSSCLQRTALLLAYGNVYFGFGSCHTGWLLGYDAQSLNQTAVFNASPNLDGEGQWASAGGVWMGGGGPATNGDGSLYVTTGNGPWDGQTAWSDSVLKFSPSLQLQDYFTPQDFQYMDCSDMDLAAGGLMLIPGTSQAVAGGKSGKMYLLSTGNLGQEQDNDAGALWSDFFEPDLSPPFSKNCQDSVGLNTTQASNYEIYGTSAYFNGSVYLGITALKSGVPAGVRQFSLSGGTLSPGSYTADGNQQEIRGTTPVVSANGTSGGIVWMLDQGYPLQSTASGAPTNATLRAFDPTNLGNELYNSSMNPADVPGYGIKFTSPVVANGKVYISTGHDPTTASKPQGEIDVYGLN